MNKKRTLLFALLGVIIIVAATGAFLWNKAPERVDDKTGVKITADALTKAFEENEQHANATYINKVLEVSGTISELSKNQDGKTVAILQSEDPMSGVQCTIRDTGVRLDNGETVTIKGFCNGYTTVVLLSDCIKSN